MYDANQIPTNAKKAPDLILSLQARRISNHLHAKTEDNQERETAEKAWVATKNSSCYARRGPPNSIWTSLTASLSGKGTWTPGGAALVADLMLVSNKFSKSRRCVATVFVELRCFLTAEQTSRFRLCGTRRRLAYEKRGGKKGWKLTSGSFFTMASSVLHEHGLAQPLPLLVSEKQRPCVEPMLVMFSP